MLFQNTEIDGLNIFYREAGEETAPKVVLLHGFPASSHRYRDLIPALAEGFHVIAPDYPGFGNSDNAGSKDVPLHLRQNVRDHRVVSQEGRLHPFWTLPPGLWRPRSASGS
jgi:pimeloyl-ACP methyl ester carboxylesterase